MAEESKPAASYWKCSSCGYVIQQDMPPDPCPLCTKKCEFVNVTCYAPECGFSGPDPRLAGGIK